MAGGLWMREEMEVRGYKRHGVGPRSVGVRGEGSGEGKGGRSLLGPSTLPLKAPHQTQVLVPSLLGTCCVTSDQSGGPPEPQIFLSNMWITSALPTTSPRME